ncbi:uncharacterized protein LOC117124454 [Anneissia japonica]|uniref:uncharacterized protein LOC117124454 n=1 Tax=Anneissia japonica TaxID=1529436 RepID=UPI001425808A|nr:uncharacterized protein LOC117124454 [Anneissia japonica]
MASNNSDLKKFHAVLLDAYILMFPLGFFGAHHFYLKRTRWGYLYLCTLGLCGLGWFFDLYRMRNLVKRSKLVNDDTQQESQSDLYDLGDAWITALCPITGLLGFHHYYLERYGWGVLYTCTVGLFGLGWIFDNIRMPLLVKRANNDDESYTLDDAYILAFNPVGVFGFHHFYLKRNKWGKLYIFTAGMFGVGWLVDLFRLKLLVDISNDNVDDSRTPHANTSSEVPRPDLGVHGRPNNAYYPSHQIIFASYCYYRYFWNFDSQRIMMSSSKDAEANSNAHDDFQTTESSTVTVTHESVLTRTKSLLDAYILLLPLGFFGAHHFYLKRTGWGFLYLFTFGLCGLGWLLDLFRMPYLVKRANHKLMNPDFPVDKSRDLGDTWIISFFPITGLLGFHHYYLGRIGWGVLYTCTVGLCGLGWVFDNIRMPLLVKRVNMKMCEDGGHADKCYKLDDVYVIAFNPFGVLGFHHFYLKRYGWGMLYLFTVGGFGVGWLVDLCRMKMLVDQKNLEICHDNYARYHSSSTPNYGATTPEVPEPQYQPHPHYNQSYGYEPPTPGAGDYQPGPPSYQPPDSYPMKSGYPIPPDGIQYPPPTHPGYPTANPPPPY